MFKSIWSAFTFCSHASLLVACAGAGLVACSGSDKTDLSGGAETADSVGTMQLALTARGASGALYRLRQGVFQIEQLGGSEEPGLPPPPVDPPIFSPGPRPAPPMQGGVDAGVAGSSTGGFAGSLGMAGSPGIAGSGGAPTGGVGGTAGASSGGFGGSGGGLFFTSLFTEDDPLATTLETDLPTGQYLITLFDGWFLERVEFGEVTVVDAELVSSSVVDFFISPNEETFVSYRFETDGDVVDFGQGRLIVDIEVEEGRGGGGGGDPRLGVMENAIEALPFSLEETLAAAIGNAGSNLDALRAYHAIIDSYATTSGGRDPSAVHCDEQLIDGQATLNGFPIQCPRLEAEQFDNIAEWFATAAVNRLDLAPADGANCGQQRLVFANNAPIGAGRMFIIIESQIPNPQPGCGVAACAPIAEFWSRLSQIADPFERGVRLREAFLSGSPELATAGFTPFINAAQLGVEGGQIRTNNFNDFIWTLREFHFKDIAEPPVPVPVAESPNGALWNDLSGLLQGPACRESFLRGAELGLLTDNVSAMSFPVDEACKDAESRNDGSQDYGFNLLEGSGDFEQQLDAIGAPFGLSALDLANRARFAGSCMGCHIEAGGSFLGGGVSAPFQFDFVQISEFGLEPCGNGGSCFGISDGLRSQFLPHRQRVAQALMEGPRCGGAVPPEEGPIGEPVPLPAPGAPAPAPDAPRTSPSAGSSGQAIAPPPAEVRYTLGGQLVDEHAH